MNNTSTPEVFLTTRAGTEQRVTVELARTGSERERGLMFRQSLESGRGMLFIFPTSERLQFWMKNTYIPLDMIFIDADLKVVGIEENAEPLTLTARGPAVLARYVLEVPGGWSKKTGIEIGSKVRYSGIDL